MSKVELYIPSIDRANRLITTDSLPKKWLKRTTIVVPLGQVGAYYAAVEKKITVSGHPASCKNIGMVRAYIMQESRAKYVFMLDDDCLFYKRKEDSPQPRLVSIGEEDVDKALDMLVEWLDKEPDVAQVGLSLSIFNCRKQEKAYYNERCTTVVGLRSSAYFKSGPRYSDTPLHEDNHVTLGLLEMGFKVKVSYKYAFQNISPVGNTGCTAYRNRESLESACSFMKSYHPRYVTYKEAKNSKSRFGGLPYIVIKWKKAYEDGIKTQTDRYRVRFMTPKERTKLPKAHKKHPLSKDFEYVWTKFHNWEDSPPIVVLDGRKIVGFHAVTFNKKNQYINSYYLYVDSAYRGKRLGGLLYEFSLVEANRRGLTRYKNACKIGGEGDVFYHGFGLKPVAVDHDHIYFDYDIQNISSLEEFRRRKKKYNVPEKELERHRKKGRQVLV